MTPALEVANLVAYRRGRPLFKAATFSLTPGDCVFLTGSNGIGKSTLLECIAGLYRDWSGNIHFSKGQLSYFQQGQSYVRTLTLSQTARLVDGFDEARYHDLLNRLRLDTVDSKELSKLAGGELQRARLLLTLLRWHSVLLLDEPFANVDVESCTKIAKYLQDTRSSRAMLIVTHQQDTKKVAIAGSLTYALEPAKCAT